MFEECVGCAERTAAANSESRQLRNEMALADAIGARERFKPN
jgi:hypothetical protein